MNKSVLITGGAGFIGSNFLPYFCKKYPDCRVVNLDALTYAGNLEHLKELDTHPNYHFVEGNICNKETLRKVFEAHRIQAVIHFAAESHVDNSILSPEAFVQTNVLGTFCLLEVARDFWMQAPNQYKLEFAESRFHHISTDEVYGSLGESGYFTEESAYAPNSPYSASKAGSDMFVRSYFHTYGLNVVTTNCSNNYGPKQHDEKLIPVIIRKALSGDRIPIYGDGKNIRDWLYVLDHCKGIELVFRKGVAGETYAIGGHNERNNNQIAAEICGILDHLRPLSDGSSYQELISYVEDRPGHDRRYAIDSTKIRDELGWFAEENFESGIQKTVQWYLENTVIGAHSTS